MGAPTPLELLSRERGDWHMAFGERAALEGLLAHLRPSLSIEVGTAQGGSLRRIAAFSEHVHAFDFAPAVDAPPPNVTFHVGEGTVLVPEALERFVAEGRNVDFALVDADHTTDGVRRDLENLLGSDAVRRTVIVVHDAGHEQVAEAIRQFPYAAYGKVTLVDPDWVPRSPRQERSALGEVWGGLALLTVDVEQDKPPADPIRQASRTVWATSFWQAFAPARRLKRRTKELVRRRLPFVARPRGHR